MSSSASAKWCHSPFFVFLVFVLARVGVAQTAAPPPSVKAEEKTADRVVFVIPNNRTVDDDNSRQFEPIGSWKKFKLSAADTIDPYAFISSGINAAAEQAAKDHEAYGQGTQGFAKRYGADFADEATSEMLQGWLYPVLFRQDPRYFRMQLGGFRKRAGYSLTRSFVTFSDRGGREFNWSETLGAISAAAISNAYYPQVDRSVGQTFTRGGVIVFEDAAFNLLKEFWPDIHHKLFRTHKVNTE